MHAINDSGKGYYYGDQAHPYIKRVVDHLPAGRLLLAGETAGYHAAYAAQAGWKVHALGFKPEDQEHTLALAKEQGVSVEFSLFEEGKPLGEGLLFDAVVILFVHLPAELRKTFHSTLTRLLTPDGGNLYLLAYSQTQPANTQARLPQLRYTEAELVEDFKDLQIDLLQEEEEELPNSREKVRLIHLTAVRNEQHDDRDSFTFEIG